MAADSPLLTVQNLNVAYNNDIVLSDISFEIEKCTNMAIIGPNGAGKSTLMKAIMGLIPIQSGTITVSDKNLLGYIPQHNEVNWDFPVTVRDVVQMGLIRRIGWFRFAQRRHREAVDYALERVQLIEYADQQVGELSGGQRRRVFIARALVQDTQILLMDEPFAGVDVSAEANLMDVLDEIHEQGVTIILSTHDIEMAFSRFETVMALNKRIIGIGASEQVYTADVLTDLYGTQITLLENGQVMMIMEVPDHH